MYLNLDRACFTTFGVFAFVRPDRGKRFRVGWRDTLKRREKKRKKKRKKKKEEKSSPSIRFDSTRAVVCWAPLGCRKVCRLRKERTEEGKGCRLRGECSFSGIVNRYLYRPDAHAFEPTILERSAYQSDVKTRFNTLAHLLVTTTESGLGLTCSLARGEIISHLRVIANVEM